MSDKPKILAGKLTISRRNNSHENPFPIAIVLHDELSGREVVTIEVGLKEFAEILTGVARNECRFEMVSGLPGVVGKHREIKTEVVLIPGNAWDDKKPRLAATRAALRPLEVDGWEGKAEDAFNSKHRVGGPTGGKEGDWYQITFVRYVEAEEPTT